MKNVDRGFREGGDLTNKKAAVVSGGGGDCQLSAAIAVSALEIVDSGSRAWQPPFRREVG